MAALASETHSPAGSTEGASDPFALSFPSPQSISEDEIKQRLGAEADELLAVLDGTPSLQSFLSGRWELTASDIEKVLGSEALQRVEEVVKPRMDHVFGLRRNLVNLKKVYLHLYTPGKELEKRINQYTCLFYVDGKNWYEHLIQEEALDTWRRPTQNSGAALYREVSEALQECKGTLASVLDARTFIKRICCVPRHPFKPTCFDLQHMPATFWSAQVILDMSKESEGLVDEQLAQERLAFLQTVRTTAKPEESPSDRQARVLLDDLVDDILGALDAKDNASLRKFIKCSCVARGVSKALRIDLEEERVQQGLQELIDEFSATQKRLKEETEGSPHSFYKMAKFIRQLEASSLVLTDLLTWMKRIREEPNKLWFVAHDQSASASLIVPPGFDAIKTIYDSLENVLEKWRPKLEARLSDPENPDYAPFLKGRKKCSRCKVQYSKPFVANNGLCYFCEKAARQAAADAAGELTDEALKNGTLLPCTLQLRCVPKGGSKPMMPTMCPHAHRCFVCDDWTCEMCNAVRLDGSGMEALAEELDPDFLLFDFDRTLASTRSGSDPLVVKNGIEHTLDPHLSAIASGRPRGSVHVVTRNSHLRQIEQFLAERGFEHVEVHSLRHIPEAQDKADIIRSIMAGAENQTAVFVDDSWQEVLTPSIRNTIRTTLPQLRVVLFDRAAASV